MLQRKNCKEFNDENIFFITRLNFVEIYISFAATCKAMAVFTRHLSVLQFFYFRYFCNC